MCTLGTEHQANLVSMRLYNLLLDHYVQEMHYHMPFPDKNAKKFTWRRGIAPPQASPKAENDNMLRIAPSQ